VKYISKDKRIIVDK